MANQFSAEQAVIIKDGRTRRSVWTEPPRSETFEVDDVPDGTRGTVEAVAAGGDLYIVSLQTVTTEGPQKVYDFFAESELEPA